MVCSTPNALSSNDLSPRVLSPCVLSPRALCTDGLSEIVLYSKKLWSKSGLLDDFRNAIFG